MPEKVMFGDITVKKIQGMRNLTSAPVILLITKTMPSKSIIRIISVIVIIIMITFKIIYARDYLDDLLYTAIPYFKILFSSKLL